MTNFASLRSFSTPGTFLQTAGLTLLESGPCQVVVGAFLHNVAGERLVVPSSTTERLQKEGRPGEEPVQSYRQVVLKKTGRCLLMNLLTCELSPTS
jgi:hypothetical protein